MTPSAIKQREHQAKPGQREKSLEGKRRWRADPENKQKDNDYNILSRYGLTRSQYNEKLIAQGGVCAICKQICKTKNQLSVDHNHTTGQIRDLLCKGCNRWVGILESAHILTKCEEYLAKHNEVIS